MSDDGTGRHECVLLYVSVVQEDKIPSVFGGRVQDSYYPCVTRRVHSLDDVHGFLDDLEG